MGTRFGISLLFKDKNVKPHAIREGDLTARIFNSDDPHEVELYQRFRFHYWVERYKCIRRPDESTDLEYDDYDEHAVHFGAFDNKDHLVGYSRFILPGYHGLQVFNVFEELVHPRVKGAPNIGKSSMQAPNISKCVESSRLLVIPERGIKRHLVAQLIYKLKYQFMKRNGYRFWCIVAEKKLIRALRFQKYPFEVMGEGKYYLGAVRYPAIMDIDRADSVLKLKEPVYFRWLNEGLED